MADVLVAVVSYNNLELTKRAVDALRNQTVPVDIAVWDNASTDGTSDWLVSEPDLLKVASRDNVLWTPAVNRLMGMFARDQRVVGYMNNDAAPLPHAVERCLTLLERPEVGIVAPSMARIGGPQDIAHCRGHDAVANGGDVRSVEHLLEGLPPKRVTYVLGAFALLRRDAWDLVGPLADDMPLGADDHDYCIRVKDAGLQIWVAQDAFCEHAGHASARGDGEQQWTDWGAKSWERFNEKWAGYYRTEEEAIKCHWGGEYHEGWEVGTGWSDVL